MLSKLNLMPGKFTWHPSHLFNELAVLLFKTGNSVISVKPLGSASIALSALIMAGLLVNTAVMATDLAKEKRWKEQLTDGLLDGEVITLNDGRNDFIAIDTRAEEANDVGIIILHGIGVHPDWANVIRPLRLQLAAEGWNTLSLQMPVLANDAKVRDYEPLMKEVPARIDAGIRYMSKNDAKKVIIVAHSMGAQMANYYLAHKKSYREAQTETPIIAYIGIGMNAGNTKYLKKIKLPILDLYGENDLPGVLQSKDQRAFSARSNKKYKQQKVAGADHFFENQDEDLVKAVKDELLKF